MYNAPINPGYRELYNTGLFRNQASVSSFIQFYSRYDFCEPPKVSIALSPAWLLHECACNFSLQILPLRRVDENNMFVAVMTERYQVTKIGLYMNPDEVKEVQHLEETIQRVLFKFFKGKVSSLCDRAYPWSMCCSGS